MQSPCTQTWYIIERRKDSKSGQLLQLAASDSLCLPAVCREEKVHAAVVNVGGVLKKRVDHVPDGGCSIWSIHERTRGHGRRRKLAVVNLRFKAVFSSRITAVVRWVYDTHDRAKETSNHTVVPCHLSSTVYDTSTRKLWSMRLLYENS